MRLLLPDGSYQNWGVGHPAHWCRPLKGDKDRWILLNTRTANALVRNGYFNLDQIFACADDEILSMDWMGKKGLAEIREAKSHLDWMRDHESSMEKALREFAPMFNLTNELANLVYGVDDALPDFQEAYLLIGQMRSKLMKLNSLVEEQLFEADAAALQPEMPV